MTIPPTINALLMMGSSELPSLAEKAASVHRLVALGYIASLLAVALLSWLLWTSGNKVQDAVRADADDKLVRVKIDGENAQRESDEKIAALNRQSEGLKLEAESLKREIATGQAEAARANERASALELETARQRQRAAEAERKLLELQERQKPRHLAPGQKQRLSQLAPELAGATIDIVCGDPEACAFAQEISSVLRAAGVTVTGGDGAVVTILVPFFGIEIMQRNSGPARPATMALLNAFEEFSPKPVWDTGQSLPETSVRILIGIKP